MNIGATLRIIFGILPAVRQGILVMEEVLPGKGKGEERLIMIREFIEDVLQVSGQSGVLDFIWPMIEKWIARIVKKYNEEGWPEKAIEE